MKKIKKIILTIILSLSILAPNIALAEKPVKSKNNDNSKNNYVVTNTLSPSTKEKQVKNNPYEVYIVIILAVIIRVTWSTISDIRKQKKEEKKKQEQNSDKQDINEEND